MDKKEIFVQRVYDIVSKVPKGKVITYGMVALMAGIPRAAREVGWIAHNGPSNLPWQRVVNRNGGLAKGYPGGQMGHKIDLEKDGVPVRSDMTVDLAKYLWRPSPEDIKSLELPPEIAAEINAKISFGPDRLSY
jgi:methylated-DNA-protein-cysteine methyltransferase-like protein